MKKGKLTGFHSIEAVPSQNSDQLRPLFDAPFPVKEKYTNAAPNIVPDLLKMMQMDVTATAPGMGSFGDGVNPNHVTQFRAPFETTADGMRLAPEVGNKFNAANAIAASMGVQDVSPPFNLFAPVDAAGGFGVARSAARPQTPEGGKAALAAMRKHGFTDISTGPHGTIGFPGDSGGNVKGVGPDIGARTVRGNLVGSDWLDFAPDWADPGKGRVTDRLLGYADQVPGLQDSLMNTPAGQAIRDAVMQRHAADEAASAQGWGNSRPDVANLRSAFSEGGIDGVRRARQGGVTLPAVTGAVPPFVPTDDDR